jgi:hypothetical protein
MKARRVLAIIALTIAGPLSLFLCLLGLMALAWGGLGHGFEAAKRIGFLLPFFLALPLFIFSLGGTRFASLGLWALVPYHWFWLVQLSSGGPNHGFLQFLEFLALCVCQRQLLALVLLAVLVQFGLQAFNQFSFDEYLYKRMRGASEPAA